MARRVVGGTVAALVLAGLAMGAMAADPPKPKTFEQVLKLKELGFSDDEVKAVAEKSGTALELTDAQIKQLRDAGAGDDLIKALRPKPRKMTVQDVVKLAKEGKSLEQIVDALAASESRPAVTAEEAAALVEQDVEGPVLVLLKGKPLGLNELKMLAKAKATEAACAKLVEFLGVAAKPLEAEDALALTEAGMAKEAVALVRQRAALAVKKEAQEKARREQAEKVARAEKEDKEGKKEEEEEGGQIQDEINRRIYPPELVARWEGVFTMPNIVQQASLVLLGDGAFTLTVGKGVMEVTTSGKWLVGAGGTLSIEPDLGSAEVYRYELKGNQLKLKRGGGLFDLAKVRPPR